MTDSSDGGTVRSLRESHQILESAEQAGSLLDVQLDGHCVWPVVRRGVMASLTGTSFAVDKTSRRSFGAMLHRATDFLADCAAYAVLRPASNVFNTHTSSLSYYRDGAFRDLFADEVITAIGDVTVVETVNSAQLAHRRPNRGRHYITTSALQTAIVVSTRARVSRDVKRAAARLVDRLDATIGAASYDRDWIARALAQFVMSRRLHGLILRRIRPTRVVAIDWSQYGLVAAAHDIGAEVIEMQHGFLDRSHSGYGWSDAALAYREAMPVADRFLSFGDYWTREMTHGEFWRGRVRSVGSIPVDRVRAARPAATDANHIVVTAQGIQGERVGAYLREAIELMPPDIRLTVKIHPVYNGDADALRAALAGLAGARVVTHTDSPPVLEMIAASGMHASISSTSHYEAIALGVPTVVLPFPPYNNVMPLVEAGHAMLAATPTAFADLVRNPAYVRPSDDVARMYYEHGAIGNIIAALDTP